MKKKKERNSACSTLYWNQSKYQGRVHGVHFHSQCQSHVYNSFTDALPPKIAHSIVELSSACL